LLAHGRRFSPGTPASSTTKTGRHDIAENDVKYQKSTNQINHHTGCIVGGTESMHGFPNDVVKT
jgi:hypothetical protein